MLAEDVKSKTIEILFTSLANLIHSIENDRSSKTGTNLTEYRTIIQMYCFCLTWVLGIAENFSEKRSTLKEASTIIASTTNAATVIIYRMDYSSFDLIEDKKDKNKCQRMELVFSKSANHVNI